MTASGIDLTAAQLGAVIELLDEGVVVQGRDAEVLACNPAAARLFELDTPSLLGRVGLFAGLEASDETGRPISARDEPAAEVLSMRGPSRPRTIRYVRSSGEAAYVVLRAAALAVDAAGTPTLVATVVSAAGANAASRSDVLAAESVGRMAGAVAHDFNNLITVITGYNDLLLAGLPPDDPRRHDAEQVGKAAALAARLTRQLLVISQGRAFEPRRLQLPIVLAEMSELLRELLGSGIEFTQSADLSTPVVSADQSRTEQLVLNLVLAARARLDGHGAVRLESRLAEIDAESAHPLAGLRPGRYALLAVEDDGPALDAWTLLRMADPSDEVRAVALAALPGLVLVHGIVERSGGRLIVANRPEGGARFQVYLPASDESSAGEGASSGAAHRRAQRP
ncbi:MAG TPA: ATP-binding protein [Candidatus Acidoferrales bacterium]|nr:ATP-binding protein [Candidatus Acidoferrales bacterium]